MMSGSTRGTLSKKLWRDLRSQRGSSLAVAIVTALGVTLFVSTAGAYRNLSQSYTRSRARLALAGLHVDLATTVTAGELARVAALPGVAVAEARTEAEIPVTPPGPEARRAALRVLSLPNEGAPRLDKVLVLEGKSPGDGEVLLEKHFARHHHLGPGASLPVAGLGRALKVSGVAVSAEYLWVTRGANDFMPSPDDFGVGWMRRGALRELAGALRQPSGPADLAVAAGDGLGSQLLVDPAPGTSLAALASDVREALGSERVLAATPASELVGVKLLQMDVDGYRGMAVFFPVFFLGVAAFILFSALARLVDAQRPLVGTLLALGLPRGAVLGHYLSFALVLGGGGALVGALAGAILAPAMTYGYATELNIPFVSPALQGDLLAEGLAMGLLVSALAGLVPALRATSLRPAEAMRPPRPSLSAAARLFRRVPAPLPLHLALRDVFDRPIRSLGAALGVAAAVVLVLSTGVMMDSMRATFGAIFVGARPYDVRVDFSTPTASAPALDAARALPGVGRVETALLLPARLTAKGRHVDVQLQGLTPDARLLRSVDADGRLVPPSASGVVTTRDVAKRLHLARGDKVEVAPLLGGEPLTLELTGLADGAMGATASVERSDLDARWGLSGQATALVVQAKVPGDVTALRKRLGEAFPQALQVEDAAATRSQFDELMGLGWLMVGLMLAFGGVLAGAILFNTATLLVLERQRDLATLRALGLARREVTLLLTTEHAVLVIVGLAIGLPAGVLASKVMLNMFTGELFVFPFVLAPMTVAVTLVSVFLVALVAQWPALRQVFRMSLAEAVRVRA